MQIGLGQVGLDKSGLESILKLHEAGFEVVAGIRKDDVPDITKIARQPQIREFCPHDLSERFGSSAMTKLWLGKNGGRAVFLLRETATQLIRGYGWTGCATSEKVLHGATTFGIRLDGKVSGRGLGLPFLTTILSGSMELYGTKYVWGETWGSNIGAVKIYARAGGELVTTEDSWRPTLNPNPNEAIRGMRRDIRIFLKFPATFV